MTEVGDSTAPATAGRRLTPLGFKSKEVYVWRYLSSLLFQAVHIYNLFCYMALTCFSMWELFVLVYGSGLRVGDSTAPAARADFENLVWRFPLWAYQGAAPLLPPPQ